MPSPRQLHPPPPLLLLLLLCGGVHCLHAATASPAFGTQPASHRQLQTASPAPGQLPPLSLPLPPPPPAPPVDRTHQARLALIIFFAAIAVTGVLLGFAHALAGEFPKHPQVGPSHGRVGEPAVVDEAERIFREIDADCSGTIEPEELAAYLVTEDSGVAPSKAHALLMQLDTDGDGKISLEEWRAGWKKGIVGGGQGLSSTRSAPPSPPPSRQDNGFTPVTPGKSA